MDKNKIIQKGVPFLLDEIGADDRFHEVGGEFQVRLPTIRETPNRRAKIAASRRRC